MSDKVNKGVIRYDRLLALINLGYKQVEAQKAVKKLLEEGAAADSSGLVRGALRLLSQA